MTKHLEGDKAEKGAEGETKAAQLTPDRVTSKTDIDSVDVYSHLKTAVKPGDKASDAGKGAEAPDSAPTTRAVKAGAEKDLPRQSADYISKNFDDIDKAADGKSKGKITADDIDSYIKTNLGTLKPDELKSLEYAKSNLEEIAKTHKDGIFSGNDITKADLDGFREKRDVADAKKTAGDFEAGFKSNDLSKVNAEIAQKQKELPAEDYTRYITELNKDLHAKGVLPKDVNINDNSKVKTDDGENLSRLLSTDSAVLSVTDKDGNVGVLDRHGRKVFDLDGKHPADVDPILPDTLKQREVGKYDDFVAKKLEISAKITDKDNVPKVLDELADAAFYRENGKAPNPAELAKQRDEIIKANPSVFPKGKVPATVSADTDVTVVVDYK